MAVKKLQFEAPQFTDISHSFRRYDRLDAVGGQLLNRLTSGQERKDEQPFAFHLLLITSLVCESSLSRAPNCAFHASSSRIALTVDLLRSATYVGRHPSALE